MNVPIDNEAKPRRSQLYIWQMVRSEINIVKQKNEMMQREG